MLIWNTRTQILLAISVLSGIAAFAMWWGSDLFELPALSILGSLAPFVWTASTFAIFVALVRNNSGVARAARGAAAILMILWLWLLAAHAAFSAYDGSQSSSGDTRLLIAMPVLGLASAYLGFSKRRFGN